MKKIRIIAAVLFTAFCMGCTMNTKEGTSLLEEGKFSEAISCFEKDIAEEKHLEEAYRGVSIAHFQLGEYQEALSNFQTLLEMEKVEETPSLHAMMAVCYLQLEKYEESLASYQKALELECTEEMKQEILFNEIAIYQELGNWDVVKEKVAAYVELYPDDTRMDKTVEFLETR